MGVCIRRGDVLPLSLSRITWKLLVGDEPTLDDLRLSDNATAECASRMLDLETLGIGPDEFEAYFGEMYFVYQNSNNVEIPLIEGGAKTRVTFENAKDFANRVVQMRLHEAAEQISLIRAGMATVIPIGFLYLWKWRDLERRVCGNPEIDLTIIRKHARYDGFSEIDQVVRFMWQALETFDQDDLQSFVKFCWGRSRLPPEGSSHWGEGFKVARASDIPASGLPRAHTCFFQFDLPPYTSLQQTKERILFAIRNCVGVLIS
jgi:E3 ubiquitin-protein ligase HECTD3